MNMGKANPANMELSETNLVRYSTSRNIPEQARAVHGDMAITTPKSVATPFPPLKLAQTGKT